MNAYCDLHTHSRYSDGTAYPAQIVEEAVEAGLSAVALTDHNTVAGVPEFLERAKNTSVRAIAGVEISTGYLGKELHIVGLFLKPEDFDKITDFLSVINRRKEESNRNLIRRLNQAGYDLDYDRIRAENPGNVNRAVIAAAMLEKGYISEIKEAFKGLLSKISGYYVPPERISAFEAIEFLRSIHAVPVLAHPFLNLQEEELDTFLLRAKGCGLAAIETHYSTYSPETTAKAINMALKHGLFQSGGSDYHGSNKPDIRLGTGRGTLTVPYRFAEELEAYQKAL